jgi:hypothetical protein
VNVVALEKLRDLKLLARPRRNLQQQVAIPERLVVDDQGRAVVSPADSRSPEMAGTSAFSVRRPTT